MEKKNNKGLIVLVIVLSVLVVGLGGYIIYDKVFKEPEVKEEKNGVQTEQTKEDSTNNSTIEAEENSQTVYTFKEISKTDTTIMLGKNTYSLSITDRNTLGQYIKVNNKSLDVENYPKVSKMYIWYDLLIVVYSDLMDSNYVVYAYDNQLNALGKISSDHYGWYNEGMMNASHQEKIQFSQEKITLFHKNLGIGGEIYSLNNVSIESITCEQAKTQYANVPIQEKLEYKYKNGKLSQPTKVTVLLLKDYICK